jgi:hypothetical protein
MLFHFVCATYVEGLLDLDRYGHLVSSPRPKDNAVRGVTTAPSAPTFKKEDILHAKAPERIRDTESQAYPHKVLQSDHGIQSTTSETIAH